MIKKLEDKRNAIHIISVVIPVFNVAQYLRRCLDTVIKNTYQKLEIICVDDGSTDNSLAILREYEQLDSRIVIRTQMNGGVASARNAGLDICTGDFIAFIDPDDWIHVDYFSTLMEIQEKGNYDVVVCDHFRTKEEDVLEFKVEKNVESVYTRKDYMSSHTIKSYAWGRIYRRSVVSSIRFNGQFKFEDAFYNLIMIRKNPALKIAVIPEKLYAYFVREDSLVNRIKSKDTFFMAKSFYNCAIEESDREMKGIFLIESLKIALSTRYAFQLQGEKEKQNETQILIKKVWKLMDKKTFLYRTLVMFPFRYRCFRIINDPTMLILEKNMKKCRVLQD